MNSSANPQPGLAGAHDELRIALFGLDPELDWRAAAACRQQPPELFFPEKGQSNRPAKTVCFSCAVRASCLQWALAHDERGGVWGGLSERERRHLRSSQPGNHAAA